MSFLFLIQKWNKHRNYFHWNYGIAINPLFKLLGRGDAAETQTLGINKCSIENEF